MTGQKFTVGKLYLEVKV